MAKMHYAVKICLGLNETANTCICIKLCMYMQGVEQRRFFVDTLHRRNRGGLFYSAFLSQFWEKEGSYARSYVSNCICF